jgi:photosystem II stability/assembly factor-like uncharacterized protein
MFSNGTGFAMGDPPGTGRFVVLKTTNFGATWAHTASEPVGSASEAGWNNSLAMTDQNNMWFGTNASRVWRTTDGGGSWSSASSGSTNSYAIAFKDNLNGVVGHSTGTIRVTANGGTSWTAGTSPTTAPVTGLAHVAGSNFAWLVAGASAFRSTNNGSNWAGQALYPFAGTLSHVSLVDTEMGWTVSSSGEILRYNPSGLTGVNEEKGENIVREFHLDQNYPNPFNPTTAITFTIANAGLTTLKVYDLLGRQVAIILNEELPVGTYQRTFSATNLSSGVYVYRLQTNQLVSEKRMVLIK